MFSAMSSKTGKWVLYNISFNGAYFLLAIITCNAFNNVDGLLRFHNFCPRQDNLQLGTADKICLGLNSAMNFQN